MTTNELLAARTVAGEVKRLRASLTRALAHAEKLETALHLAILRCGTRR